MCLCIKASLDVKKEYSWEWILEIKGALETDVGRRVGEIIVCCVR